MSLQVRQSSQFLGDGWWTWSIWMEGTTTELNAIKSVEYTLHPTFPKPVILINDRSSKFKLVSGGWGEFMVYLRIEKKDGKILKKQHWLTLKDSTSKSSSSRVKSESTIEHEVFMSSAAADSSYCNTLSKELQNRGVQVLMSYDVSPGVPFSVALKTLFRTVSLVIFFISDKQNPWISHEIQAAKQSKMPVVAVVVEDASLPSELANQQAINFHDLKQTAEVADQILAILQKS